MKIKAQLLSFVLLIFTFSCSDDDGIVPSDGFVDLLQPKFEVTSDDPVVGIEVYFSDVSRGDIVERLWDFGNGETSSDSDPTTIYDLEGDYTVSLSVTDADGNTEETSQELTINPLIIDGAYVMEDDDYLFVAETGNSVQREDMVENLYFDKQEDSDSFWSDSELISGLSQLILSNTSIDSTTITVMYKIFDGEVVRTTYMDLILIDGEYQQYQYYETVNDDYLYMAQFGNEDQEANMTSYLNFFQGSSQTSETVWSENEVINALSELLIYRFSPIPLYAVYEVEYRFYASTEQLTSIKLIYNGEYFEKIVE